MGLRRMDGACGSTRKQFTNLFVNGTTFQTDRKIFIWASKGGHFYLLPSSEEEEIFF